MECFVCGEQFTWTPEFKPLLLSCGHCLCRACVLHILPTNTPPTPNATTTSTNPSPSTQPAGCCGELVCPMCRKITQIGEAGVDGLPVSEAVLVLLERQQEQPRKNKRGGEMCYECGKAKAEVFCQDCGANHCTSCSSALHKLKTLSAHRRSGLINKHDVWCGQHDKELAVFCKTCSKPVCFLCTLNGCQGHTTQHIDETEVTQQEIIQNLTDDLRQWEQFLEKRVGETTTQIKGTKAWQQHLTQTVQSYFQTLREALAMRESELVAHIESNCNARTKELQLHKDHLDLLCGSTKWLASTHTQISTDQNTSTPRAQLVTQVCKWTAQSQNVVRQCEQASTIEVGQIGSVCIFSQLGKAEHEQVLHTIKHLGEVVLLGADTNFDHISDQGGQHHQSTSTTHSSTSTKQNEADQVVGLIPSKCVGVASDRVRLGWNLGGFRLGDVGCEKMKFVVRQLGSVDQQNATRNKNKASSKVVFEGANVMQCEVGGLEPNTAHQFQLSVNVWEGVHVDVGAPVCVECSLCPRFDIVHQNCSASNDGRKVTKLSSTSGAKCRSGVLPRVDVFQWKITAKIPTGESCSRPVGISDATIQDTSSGPHIYWSINWAQRAEAVMTLDRRANTLTMLRLDNNTTQTESIAPDVDWRIYANPCCQGASIEVSLP